MSELKSCFENLFNEIFMDIFDYLYGEEIIISFHDLNSRFQFLCHSYPKFYFNIRPNIMNKKFLKKIQHSLPSKHISGLCISDQCHISRISIKYFVQLHSLKLMDFPDQLKMKEFLAKLPSPNQLYYLSLNCINNQNILKSLSKFSNLNRLELDFNRQEIDVSTIDQPLLSLQYLTISRINLNQLIKLIPFIPNLIYLKIISSYCEYGFNFTSIQTNSLLKLKTLEISDVPGYNQIDFLIQLFPCIKIFKMSCSSPCYTIDTFVNNIHWEKLLSSMKILKQIQIHVPLNYYYYLKDMDLSPYETQFWMERNLKATIKENNLFITNMS